MNAPLPKLANVESRLPGFVWTGGAVTFCPACGGSGRQYLDTGPSGLTTPCNECGGEGRWPEMESDR